LYFLLCQSIATIPANTFIASKFVNAILEDKQGSGVDITFDIGNSTGITVSIPAFYLAAPFDD